MHLVLTIALLGAFPQELPASFCPNAIASVCEYAERHVTDLDPFLDTLLEDINSVTWAGGGAKNVSILDLGSGVRAYTASIGWSVVIAELATDCSVTRVWAYQAKVGYEYLGCSSGALITLKMHPGTGLNWWQPVLASVQDGNLSVEELTGWDPAEDETREAQCP